MILRRHLLAIQISPAVQHTLSVGGSASIEAETFNMVAIYDESVDVTSSATWTIVSGGEYATVDNTGLVTINSGASASTIVIQAVYVGLNASQSVVVTYKEGSSSHTETEVVTDQSGNTTTTTTTVTENEDGSSTSSSNSVTYDASGNTIGTQTNETVNNADGSSSSTTINYNEDGDPTDRTNEVTDTSGNNSTQEITYDESGNSVVTGYEIDTSGNPDGEKNFNGEGVNTEFYAFDVTQGFKLNMHFTIDFTQQPPNQHENHHNILTMKRANPSPWYGFQIRQSSTNKYVQLGTQFATGSNTNTTIPAGRQLSSNIYEYDIEIIYDPTLSSDQFQAKELISENVFYSQSKTFPDLPELRYISVCIGCAQDENGDPYRYSNIDVKYFNIEKLTYEVLPPEIICDGRYVMIVCETSGAEIYYRLNESGSYALYSSQFKISADTVVEAYSVLRGLVSETVKETCIYDVIENPLIYCDGELVTITCETPSADIYYRLNESGLYNVYDSSIPIDSDTIVESYAQLDSKLSEVVSALCIYAPSSLVEPVISCDGEYVTLTCATPGSSIYYRLNQEGTFGIYDEPISLSADTIVEAYSELSGDTSSIVMENCIYNPTHDYSTDYLTFEIISGGTVAWNSIGTGQSKTIEYSLNNGVWTSITASSSTLINVSEGDVIRFRGTNTSYAKDKSNYSGFEGGTALFNAEGNMMSLIYGDNFIGNTAMTGTYNFCSMFKLSNVVSAENLILPSTSLTNYCYRAMFSKCTLLNAAPALPATTLSDGCYYYMFEECAFTEAPELLAQTIGKQSYYYMFTGCRNLNYIKCLATGGITTGNCTGWVNNVSATGTFVKSGESTWTTGKDGIPTGWIVYNDDVLVEPTIIYDGEQEIRMTCETINANIYYSTAATRGNGEYVLYTEPIFIDADTVVSAYSEKNGQSSSTVSETCIYVEEIPYSASNKTLTSWKYNNIDIQTPFSINAVDGHSSKYSKGTFVFETTVSLRHDQPTYLWFQHADQSADIYVDDVKVETHWGGYNAFFSDISNYAHRGTNNIKVVLCNTTRNELAPSAGDFNFNATLGNVKCFSSPVLPSMDYGYDGFHVTSDVSESAATVNVKTNIPSGATVICRIDDGTYSFSATQESTGNEIVFTTTIQNPHLWKGTLDPHLYNITLEIYKDNDLYHMYERPYGLRFYSYVFNDTSVLQSGAPYTGFLLNGSPYLLRGVCMHHDIDGKANALSDSDIAHDFEIIQELGCNFIRLAHYPHPKEVYEWCDRLGIIVQTEVPCVNRFNSPEVAGTNCPQAYYDHLDIQYTDMVRQHFNHPCIMFWGLFNEATTNDTTWAKSKLEYYKALIKNIDAERWVGYVVPQGGTNPSSVMGNPDMDWFGANIYVGWYTSKDSNNPTYQINTRANNIINNLHKPLAYSEYGAGGTQHCHSDNFTETTQSGNYPRHDIEYMMWLHEGHIAAIKNFPQLLFTGEWQLFDIAVSSRQEGYKECLDGVNVTDNNNLKYLNDKGLVERDHVTKKDTFYLYKAWWNPTPFVHICGKDYIKADDRVIKCYTNDDTPLSLYVNNVFVESGAASNYIVEFSPRRFEQGDVVRVDGSGTTDTFTFENVYHVNAIKFTAQQANSTIGLSSLSSNQTLEYSNDASTWSAFTTSSTITLSNYGDSVYVRGVLSSANTSSDYTQFSMSGSVKAIGNINYLWNKDNPNADLKEYCGDSLFKDCISLKDVSELILPSLSLVRCCYSQMFMGCTSLEVAPALPATNLGIFGPYVNMFKGCTSLEVAPALQAATVPTYGYGGMFENCTSLVTVPGISATTIGLNSYNSMFKGCTALVVAPSISATTFTDAQCCYEMFRGCSSLTTAPSILPATTLEDMCYYRMFKDCTSLTAAPVLPATTLASNCYLNMFEGCTSLEIAPDLPAETLAVSCYGNMFSGCTNLNYIKAMFTTSFSPNYTFNWVEGVGLVGTFVKNKLNDTLVVAGTNCIPSGWTVENYEVPAVKFTAKQANSTVGLSKKSSYQTLEYSTNGGTWSNMTTSTTITLANSGDNVFVRGVLRNNNSTSNYTQFTMSGNIKASGNINYLWNKDNPNTALKQFCGYGLFYGCTTLTDISELELPATTLAESCYRVMFSGCISLNTVPVLPATTLEPYCYMDMFRSCTSLTTAPALPATTLASGCYYSMFVGCNLLTTAPALPATTLATQCYYTMFYNCTNLNYIKCLATNISASNSTYRWVDGVAATGTFVKDASMTGWTIGTNGIPTGWVVEDDSVPAVKFTAKQDNSTVGLGKKSSYQTLEYSTDFETWANITTSTTITLANSGDSVYVRGVLSSNNTDYKYTKFRMFGNIKASGNINYLWNKDNPYAALKEYCGNNLFSGCTALSDASELELPATTLAANCYQGMFAGCTSLTTAPELPATTLAQRCYNAMFLGCTALTTAPALPATTLAYSCYGSMFYNCSGLTTAPELPATTLADYCYQSIFAGCTSLTTAPVLPAQTLANFCYAGMFDNCTSLTTAPALPATTLAEGCYMSIFEGCTSLTTAPVLPATALTIQCYYEMFRNCNSLNYIKCLATNISATTCTSGWVYGVASSGTFVKSPLMSDWTTGNSGIPDGWTVQDA